MDTKFISYHMSISMKIWRDICIYNMYVYHYMLPTYIMETRKQSPRRNSWKSNTTNSTHLNNASNVVNCKNQAQSQLIYYSYIWTQGNDNISSYLHKLHILNECHSHSFLYNVSSSPFMVLRWLTFMFYFRFI